MRKIISEIDLKAILIGLITGFILSFFSGFIVGAIYSVFGGMLTSADATIDTQALFVILAAGFPCSFIGGFVTARLAKGDQPINAILSGILFAFLNALVAIFITEPFWFDAIGIIAIIPLYYLGSMVVVKKLKPRRLG